MKVRIATNQQLRQVYNRDLRGSFPPEELRPLRVMERLRREGRYQPWCAFKDGEIVGELFLLLGNPGWAIGDFLCVSPERRNGGLGGEILKLVRREEPGLTILGEVEDPEGAPDGELARRRIGFYERNHARFGNFRSEVFGVLYRMIYFADAPVPDKVLMREYDAIYRSAFSPGKYAKYVRIPWTQNGTPTPKVPWDE